VHVGDQKMVIYPFEALQLIKKYFPHLVKRQYIKLGIEPKGIDLVVKRAKQTKEDKEFKPKIIAHYKLTRRK